MDKRIVTLSEEHITEVDAFEAIIAYNLNPPLRSSQEYFWLEVTAKDINELRTLALDWAAAAGNQFEFTGLYRKALPHINSLELLDGTSCEVHWNLPMPEDMEDFALMRDPSSGERLGYAGSQFAQDKWISVEDQSLFRIILRKTTGSSDPVLVAPIVKHV